MKKILIIFLVSISFCILYMTPVFAYSFTEYPLLNDSDRLKGADIIVRVDNDIYYITDSQVTDLFWDYSVGLGFNTNTEKVYQLKDNTFWLPYDIAHLGYVYGSDFEILCSNVQLEYNFTDCTGCYLNEFLPNSAVPSINWQQLCFQDLESIKGIFVTDFPFMKNVAFSIYVFLSFGIILAACALIIYFIVRPIFYFLR